MKWTKVAKMIKLNICNSSVNNEVLQTEQPPNEMNIIAKECSSCGYANTYVETIIDGYKAARPYVAACSSCLVILESIEEIEDKEDKLDETNQAMSIPDR